MRGRASSWCCSGSDSVGQAGGRPAAPRKVIPRLNRRIIDTCIIYPRLRVPQRRFFCAQTGHASLRSVQALLDTRAPGRGSSSSGDWVFVAHVRLQHRLTAAVATAAVATAHRPPPAACLAADAGHSSVRAQPAARGRRAAGSEPAGGRGRQGSRRCSQCCRCCAALGAAAAARVPAGWGGAVGCAAACQQQQPAAAVGGGRSVCAGAGAAGVGGAV